MNQTEFEELVDIFSADHQLYEDVVVQPSPPPPSPRLDDWQETHMMKTIRIHSQKFPLMDDYIVAVLSSIVPLDVCSPDENPSHDHIIAVFSQLCMAMTSPSVAAKSAKHTGTSFIHWAASCGANGLYVIKTHVMKGEDWHGRSAVGHLVLSTTLIACLKHYTDVHAQPVTPLDENAQVAQWAMFLNNFTLNAFTNTQFSVDGTPIDFMLTVMIPHCRVASTHGMPLDARIAVPWRVCSAIVARWKYDPHMFHVRGGLLLSEPIVVRTTLAYAMTKGCALGVKLIERAMAPCGGGMHNRDVNAWYRASQYQRTYVHATTFSAPVWCSEEWVAQYAAIAAVDVFSLNNHVSSRLDIVQAWINMSRAAYTDAQYRSNVPTCVRDVINSYSKHALCTLVNNRNNAYAHGMGLIGLLGTSDVVGPIDTILARLPDKALNISDNRGNTLLHFFAILCAANASTSVGRHCHHFCLTLLARWPCMAFLKNNTHQTPGDVAKGVHTHVDPNKWYEKTMLALTNAKP